MFHLNNIIDIARDLRSNANIERLDLRDKRSASAIRKHISSTEIKEEKEQDFKKQNFYNKEITLGEETPLLATQNFYNKRNLENQMCSLLK
jgi:hypothetical protein